MDLFSAKFLVLIVVALVVLGPEKLPGALRSLGRLVAEVRRLSSGLGEQAREAADQAGLSEPLAELRTASELIRDPLAAATSAPAPPPGAPKRPVPRSVGEQVGVGPAPEAQPLVASGAAEQGSRPECN